MGRTFARSLVARNITRMAGECCIQSLDHAVSLLFRATVPAFPHKPSDTRLFHFKENNTIPRA